MGSVVRRVAWAWFVATVGIGCLTSPEARAGDLPERWRTLRVGVLPVRSYARLPQELFGEGPLAERLRQESGRWQRFLESRLAQLDMVEVYSVAAVRDRLRRSVGYAERRQLAQERFMLAVEHYRTLQRRSSLTHLSRADGLHAEAHVGVADPRDAADVALYRGLVYMELGDRSRAHGAFRRMLLLDPGRTFQPGYYPAQVEETVMGAHVDLVEGVDLARARYPLDELTRMGAALEVDVWVLAFIVGPPGAPELLVQVIDPVSRVLEVSERIAAVDREHARERVDRLLTAWHADAMRAADLVESPAGARRWSVDLSYSHSLMMKHDGTRALFHSPGVRIGVRWRPSENMLVFLRAIQMVSVPDANGDLLETLVTTRVTLGAGLIGEVKEVRLSIQAGLEVGIVSSDIAMTTDVDCKHFGSEHPRCSSYPQVIAPRGLIGLHVEVGLEWGFSEAWYMTTSAGLTSYVYPREIITDLNFPLDLAIGVGTRF